MDSFFSRLKYYGIGFGIGLIFVIFFFQNRGCSWLPDNRVKNSILDRVLVLPESEAQQLKKFGLTKKDLTLVLNDGEVLFDESKKEGDPKVYVVEKEIPSHGKMKFFFSLAKESFISEIHLKLNKLNKNSFNIYIINMSNILYYSPKCQYCKDILKYLKKSGKIDYSKSHLQATPKPEHFLVFTDEKGREIGANVIWYKNKLNITNFVIPFKNSCE